MENKALAIKIWGKDVGHLTWDRRKGRATFAYTPEFADGNIDIAPITDSIRFPNAHMPRLGQEGKEYSGLPAFVSDSLPDRWGEQVFRAWASEQHIPMKKLSPLDRLTYVGRRGMGALEFEPAYEKEPLENELDPNSLWQLSLAVLNEREHAVAQWGTGMQLEDLYRVGTSAGGRRAKAIVAINEDGEVRSGQVDLPPDFTYYILKFNPCEPFPFAEVEMAYHLMALAAGIRMMPSRLIDIGDKRHFLTQRFDRVGGEKVHLLTLAGMDPLADCYEDLMAVCRKLQLPIKQQEEAFRQAAFNFLAHNIDDHTKNFSFTMNRQGQWSLAPAYDLIFSEEPNAPRYANRHCMPLRGKSDQVTRKDLLDFGTRNDITHARTIVDQVADAVARWPQFAAEAGVPQEWTETISRIINDNEQ